MEKQNIELYLDGFRYFYRVYPNPESNLAPIVVLGGVFQPMDTLTRYAQYITQFAPVILVDLPGSGDADPLPEHYDVDFLTTALLKVLTTRQTPRVNVFAASYSTPIAYRFGQLHPDKVDRMVLTGIMKGIPSYLVKPVETTLTLLQEGRVGDFANFMTSILTCQDKQKSINKRRLVERIMPSMLKKLSPDHQNKYKQNTLRLLNHPPLALTPPPNISALVVTGQHDPYTTPEYCREIAKSFSNSLYTTIRDADHLCHLQQLQTTMDLITNFFMNRPLESVANCTPIEYFGKQPPIEPAA